MEFQQLLTNVDAIFGWSCFQGQFIAYKKQKPFITLLCSHIVNYLKSSSKIVRKPEKVKEKTAKPVSFCTKWRKIEVLLFCDLNDQCIKLL